MRAFTPEPSQHVIRNIDLTALQKAAEQQANKEAQLQQLLHSVQQNYLNSHPQTDK